MLTAVRLGPRLDCGSVLVVSVGVGCVLAPAIKNRTSECAHVSSSVALRALGGGERAAPEVDPATAVSGGRLWRRERASERDRDRSGQEGGVLCYFGIFFRPLLLLGLEVPGTKDEKQDGREGDRDHHHHAHNPKI